MPTYDYLCQEHGEFEAMKKISERDVAVCPECGVECPHIITAPKMVKGNYMDNAYRFSQK